eukprot:jgi/Mesvir1/13538/Mv04544-RA.1
MASTILDVEILEAVHLLYSDDIDGAETAFRALLEAQPKEPRCALGCAEVSFLKAFLSFEEDDITVAIANLWEAEKMAEVALASVNTHDELSYKQSATRRLSSAIKWVKGTKSSTTETTAPVLSEEAVLEERARLRRKLELLLVQADCYAMVGLLQLIKGTESWSLLPKAFYHVRKAWKHYLKCETVLRRLSLPLTAVQHVEDLDADVDALEEAAIAAAKKHSAEMSDEGSSTGRVSAGAATTSSTAENTPTAGTPPGGVSSLSPEDAPAAAGVDFGLGFFNLIVSLAPPGFSSVIEIIGFSGDRELGLACLHSAAQKGAVRSPLALLLLLEYYVVLASFLPYAPEYAEHADEILDAVPGRMRECAVVRVIESRFQRYQHKLSNSLALTAAPSSMEHRFPAMKHLRLYERAFCAAIGGQDDGNDGFLVAADALQVLLEESKWSKAFYAYFQACCLYEHSTGRHDHRVHSLLEQVPVLVTRSKSPLEAFALRRAKSYLANGALPCLPTLEVLCFWQSMQQMRPNRLLHIAVTCARLLEAEKSAHVNVNVGVSLAARMARSRSTARSESRKLSDVTAGDAPARDAAPTSANSNSGGEDLAALAAQSVVEPNDSMSASELRRSQEGLRKSMDAARKSSEGSMGGPGVTASGPGTAEYAPRYVWGHEEEMRLLYFLGVALFHMGSIPEAIESLTVVANATDLGSDKYLAAFACMTLGNLYMQDARLPEAKAMYKKGMGFSGYDFQPRLRFICAEQLHKLKVQIHMHEEAEMAEAAA